MKKITVFLSSITLMLLMAVQSNGQCTANGLTYAIGTTTCINGKSLTCAQGGWQDNNSSCNSVSRENIQLATATKLLSSNVSENVLVAAVAFNSANYWVGTDPRNNIYAVPVFGVSEDRAKCLIRLSCGCVVNSLIQLNGDQVNSGSLNGVTVTYISPGAQCQ